jgi:hypothetical protein
MLLMLWNVIELVLMILDIGSLLCELGEGFLKLIGVRDSSYW